MSDQEMKDKKLALDFEIRSLLAYAFEEFGQKGVDHVKNAASEISKLIQCGSINPNEKWVNEEALISVNH